MLLPMYHSRKRLICGIVLLLGIMAFARFPQDASAELIRGTLIYHFSEFMSSEGEHFGIDFSEGELYGGPFWVNEKDYDVTWHDFFEAGAYFSGQLIQLSVALAEVKVAPETGYQSQVPPTPILDTYVCITKEGNYAKFTTDRKRSENEYGYVIEITYVYQTDGSGNLDGGSIVIEKTSWGKIKWLWGKGRT